jgi:hypothetical protein
LFAVGYYVCVLFWAMAFILVDVLHAAAATRANEIMMPVAEPQFLAAASGQ